MSPEQGHEENMTRLRIKDEKNLKQHILAIFEKHDHQHAIIIDLYKMVIPEWDQVKKVEGYPEAGDELWKYICKKFQEFDHKHHPDVMPGGAWMNWGFSTDHELKPWEISLKNCKLRFGT